MYRSPSLCSLFLIWSRWFSSIVLLLRTRKNILFSLKHREVALSVNPCLACRSLGVVDQQCCVRLHKVWPVSNYTQQVPTSTNIVMVPCKRTQQVTTLLGPIMLGVFGQQCWVHLHGPLSYFPEDKARSEKPGMKHELFNIKFSARKHSSRIENIFRAFEKNAVCIHGFVCFNS